MINIFVDNFNHPHPVRMAEFNYCIEKNSAIPGIKFIQINSPNRMTYKNLFNYINSQTNNKDVNVISNLDIYFDDTIQLLENITNDHFVALSRHELNHLGESELVLDHVKHTQDVWAWRGSIRLFGIDFYPGTWGCDNRLAHEAYCVGYNVINPCLSVHAYHYHLSGIHREDYKFEVVQGPKLFVFPCHI